MMDGKAEREKERCVWERGAKEREAEGEEGIKKGQGHVEPKPSNPLYADGFVGTRETGGSRKRDSVPFCMCDKGPDFAPPYIPCNQTQTPQLHDRFD